MSTPLQAPSTRQRIIIHHLSDLHYHQGARSAGVDPLVQYRGHVEELSVEQRPDLLVITGDVTATGTRSDLSTVAVLLRTGFPKWATELAQHIIVVPGPRDLNWEGTDPPGLKSFYEALGEFALPSMAHARPQPGTQQNSKLNIVAYPLDTCYSLEECRGDLKDQYRQYGETYHAFVRRYQEVKRGAWGRFRFGSRDRTKELTELRERYLRLTEANDLTLLDAGRVHPEDLKAFQEWVKSLEQSASTGQTSSEPLKVLITHHPLVVQPESTTSPRTTRGTDAYFEQLATSARKAGFHLALHGHIHRPQVLSDLSLLQGQDVRHPMRQVGAGSLGDGGTFNEISATYSVEGDQSQWRLEIRTINLAAANPSQSTYFVLLNPASETKSAEQLKLDATRQEFDSRIRSVMRKFSETTYRMQPDDPASRAAHVLLPQSAMQDVESILREVVFPRMGLRVRLFLKELQRRPIPKLTATYLAPQLGDGSGPVQYPVSLAALSLILGRTLCYPNHLEERLDERDEVWLRRSGKDRELDRILGELVQEVYATSYPGPEEAQRYDSLRARLAQWLSDPVHAPAPSVKDFYREAPPRDSAQDYPNFVCVPFPQRSSDGVPPEVPEVAVLVVSVRAFEQGEREQREKAKLGVTSQELFSTERIGMLESLAELTGTMLITSSALGKPKGVWDARFRV